MYEYRNYEWGCGCGDGDYHEDSIALERLAREAERAEAEDCGEQYQDRRGCDQRYAQEQRRCGSPRNVDGADHCGGGCGICRLVNCVRRTIFGCGCRNRRNR